MTKEKVFLEYTLKGSAVMIWKHIGTAAGLSPWFADKVESFDRTFTFYWGKTEKRVAHLVAVPLKREIQNLEERIVK